MTRKSSWLALAVAVVMSAGAACSKPARPPADSTVNADISLAVQQQRFQLDSAERAGEARARAGTMQTTHRATSSGDVAQSRGAAATTSSGGTVVKHTNRDAAIGAAAGAIIGATTSRNKVQGGVIGAAVGGILGGVIGNNVDKTKKKP